MGHEPTSAVPRGMSALTLKADLTAAARQVNSGPTADVALSGTADADETVRGKYLSLMACGTRYDDNFFGDKDGISACLDDGGRTRAASFGV